MENRDRGDRRRLSFKIRDAMTLTLYAHPFSSYCQKVQIALYENELPFLYRHLEHPGAAEERAALWPIGRFPVLVDGGLTVAESSIIIEHLQLYHPGPVRLLPDDPKAALEVRFLDRFFDHYVMEAMQKPVFAAIEGDAARKDAAMDAARKALDIAYGWLDNKLSDRSMGGRRRLHHGRLRRSAEPVLCRLGPPDRRGISEDARLSGAVAGKAVRCALRRGGASLSVLFSARRARPRLRRSKVPLLQNVISPGSISACMRFEAMRAVRTRISLRRAPASGWCGASRMISPP